MSWTWFIYTPLSAKAVLEIEGELARSLTEWTDQNGEDAAEELMETCGEVGPGGPIPSAEEVVRTQAKFGQSVEPMVLERLRVCRSSLAIDRIRGSGLEHPLQVSILRFLLDRMGDSLVDWGEHRIALAEKALQDLTRYRSRRFGEAQRDVRKPVRVRKERPGELRSVRIWSALERCANDPDLSIDLSRARSAMSKNQLAYIELLASNGALEDRRAASSLGMSSSELEDELNALEQALSKLVN